MIDWIEAGWHPHLNINVFRCDCGCLWSSWANFSLVECPNCGERAWVYANETSWDPRIPAVRRKVPT